MAFVGQQAVEFYGWLSADDSLLYLALYENEPDAVWRPHTDLAVAKLGPGERYRSATLLGGANEAGYEEQRPVAALGGRMLFFTSDRSAGFGGFDRVRN